jgi:catechol 2,3-dioxygenase-like lactoylglutathione lyase family enzyme
MAALDRIAKTKSLDHLVLTVRDLDATIKFYTEVMGMQVETFESGGESRFALKFGSSKINLHVHGKEFEPKAQVSNASRRSF